jgi:hypothetical protein
MSVSTITLNPTNDPSLDGTYKIPLIIIQSVVRFRCIRKNEWYCQTYIRHQTIGKSKKNFLRFDFSLINLLFRHFFLLMKIILNSTVY